MAIETKQVPKLLGQILTSKRAHGSKGEQQFRVWLMASLRDMKAEPTVMEDNIVVTVGKDSKTLFSCHIDTVHSSALCDGSRQKLAYDPSFGHVFLEESSKVGGACLGADDGAGIYVLMRMIEAGVAGTYIFHVGEERGGIGANDMRAKHKDFLKKFTHAIAFDRAGNSDIVYKQGGTQCASIECAEALCSAFNESPGLDFKPSDKGTFTDTKVYAGIISECFNISVGYLNQYSADESLDVYFLEDLVTTSINLDWSALPVKRVPAAFGVYESKKAPSQPFFGFTGNSFREHTKTSAIPSLSPIDELEDLNIVELQDVAAGDPDLIAAAYVLLRARVRGLEAQVEALEEALN